jgi:hypothetical protein
MSATTPAGGVYELPQELLELRATIAKIAAGADRAACGRDRS